MPTDQERLARLMAEPLLLRLHRKLERLSSVLTVMNTGAHPDDESSGLLAVLRFGFGIRAVIACATRGEGGQNGIGAERGGALGVLRTREMEEAARVLDAGIAWLGHGPGDPVHDFGFSKNGDDTLARWGEERIVERLVRAYRRDRPDIVIPTFLDVPGQHGHHRAMTRAAETALDRAADPAAYPEHLAEGLAPWRVAKFYLPAWSGASSSYDDELPPPPATLTVRAPGVDGATGVAFGHIGEWSRAQHRCQGMGRWREPPQDAWPLHLRRAAGAAGPEDDIRDGLAATLGALAALDGMPRAAAASLADAEAAIGRARAAFPDGAAIAEAATAAARAVGRARDALPDALRPDLGHRLDRKLRELDAVIFEAAGVSARAWLEPAWPAAGSTAKLSVAVSAPAGGAPVTVDAVAGAGLAVRRGPEGEPDRFALIAAPDAAPAGQWPASFDPLGGNGAAWVRLSMETGGRRAEIRVDLDEAVRVMPSAQVALDPDAAIVNRAAGVKPLTVAAALDGRDPARLDLAVPPGWQVRRGPTVARRASFQLLPAADQVPGIHKVTPTVDGRPAHRVTAIAYPHIGRAAFVQPEILRVLALDAALPDGARIGYAGGGNDRVGLWLSRLGLDVTELDADLLGRGDLGRFTTIVVGIMAFGTRPDLAAARPHLHRWTESGGHLVTLYHRPSDGWNPATTPPLRLEIGAPSLRWRVTDPAAPVTVLAPGHVLLAGPNRIGDADWQGWDKERGLYFAAARDPAYVPLLAMNDPGEAPLDGALVSAPVGSGRHTHVSLALHHQLDRLVPGAFRLLANLVQPA